MGENGERGAHPGRVGRRERKREAAVRRVCSADPREEAGARPAGSPRGGAGSGGGWPCPEHGRLLRQASFAANTHTLRMFSRTGTSLGAGNTGNPVCSQKTLTTHEFACVALQLDTCNGSS